MNFKNRFQNLSKEDILYYSLLFLIFAGSFFLFSPMYLPEFGSDHAIHVIMSVRNDYPHDIYFWGQNRLGSLVPELTSYFLKIIPIHPLVAISIVNHLLIFGFYFLLQKTLNSRWSKIALAFVIFFPLYTFTALIHISHPYTPQLFTGTFGIYFLHLAIQQIRQKNSFSDVWIFVYGIFSAFLLGMSVWVSESSVLFFIFILVYFLWNKELRNKLVSVAKHHWKIAAGWFILTLGIGVFWLIKITQFKKYYEVNEEYDQVFISDKTQIAEQFGWMKEKFGNQLAFAVEDTTTGIFSWIIVLTIPILILFARSKKSALSVALFITILFGFISIFFSAWNYRSQFEPRYLSILYPILLLWILVKAEQLFSEKKISLAISGLGISLLLFLHNFHFISDHQPGPLARFGDFEKLEPGGVIGNYWQVYRVCAMSPYKLKGIAKEGDPVRNDFMMDEVMSEKIIYVIKTDFYPDERELPDTLMQHGFTLVKTSDKIEEIGFVQYEKYKVLWWRK